LTSSRDFAPVTEKGELQAASGLLGRLGRRHDLEPLDGGFARILLDEHGAPVASGKQLSAGQKYWARARSWVKIDTRAHRLEYDVEFSDRSGSAGFVAKIAVTASVVNAQGAAKDGCTSAGEILVPVLSEAIEVATGRTAPPSEGNPVADLNAAREQASAAARKLVGKPLKAPKWLSATVDAVSIEFDQVTAKRHADLIETRHGSHLIEAEGENKQIEAETEMKLRDIVRTSLEPHLRDSVGREIEAVVSNPSTENINAFAAKMADGEGERQQALFAVVQQLIDKDYLDKDDPIYRTLVEVSSKALEGMYGGQSPALSAGDTPPEIPAESDGAEDAADVEDGNQDDDTD